MENSGDGNNSKKKSKLPLYSMYRGPGPAYRLRTSLGTKEHCLTKKQAPAFTMGHKYTEDKVVGPGPIYNYDSALTSQGKKHAPAHVISSRPKRKEVEKTPGPSDYDTVALKDGVLSKERKPPAVTIGRRTKTLDRGPVPPPNKYNTSSGIGSRSQTAPYAPAWTLPGRSDVGGSHYVAIKAAGPGPASYGAVPPRVYKSSSAAAGGCTMQGRTKTKDYTSIKDNPGPNSYDPRGITGQRKKGGGGFTMGIRHSEYVLPLISDIDIV